MGVGRRGVDGAPKGGAYTPRIHISIYLLDLFLDAYFPPNASRPLLPPPPRYLPCLCPPFSFRPPSATLPAASPWRWTRRRRTRSVPPAMAHLMCSQRRSWRR